MSAHPASVVVIGNFDGVHRGHAAMVDCAVAEANEKRARAIALTFDPHPAAYLKTEEKPLICSVDRRCALLAARGIDRTHVQAFDTAFAAKSPIEFLEWIQSEFQCTSIVVGEDFRYGKNREGDIVSLRAFGAARGIAVTGVPLVTDERGPFSSTRVREALARGDVKEAAAVLGRAHELVGPVVHGRALGRTIGFPTANLSVDDGMIPALAVYAVRVLLPDERSVPGVLSVGTRPTIEDNGAVSVEAHLFDFAEDLYGKRVALQLVEQIRPDERFSGLDELTAQIARDAARARAILASL